MRSEFKSATKQPTNFLAGIETGRDVVIDRQRSLRWTGLKRLTKNLRNERNLGIKRNLQIERNLEIERNSRDKKNLKI